MNKVLIAIVIIFSVFALIQWWVFSAGRRYLFKIYEPMKRSQAYLVLFIIIVINLAAVGVVLHPQLFAANSLIRYLFSLSYFTYFGWILLLGIIYLLVALIYRSMRIFDYLAGIRSSARQNFHVLPSNERGCVGLPHDECESLAPEKAEPSSEYSPNLPTRRAFLQLTAGTGVVLATGSAASGLVEAYQKPLIEEFDFFHHALNGLDKPVTVIQVTDFHYGVFMRDEELEGLVDQLNSTAGEALLITGDVFHTAGTPVREAVPILSKLRERKFGNFVILGNHDFYAGEARVVKALKDSGLTLLRDEWITHRAGEVNIHIGGMDDPRVNWVWGADFPKYADFVRKASTDSGLKILLSHRPNILPAAAVTDMDFILAGHIHGGQIIVPIPGNPKGWSIASIASNYTHGWYQEKQSRLYLNRGVGLTFVPWRINCPPEIAVFHLQAANGSKDRVQRSLTNKVVKI